MKSAFPLLFLILSFQLCLGQEYASPSLIADASEEGIGYLESTPPLEPRKYFKEDRCEERMQEWLDTYGRNKDFKDKALLPSLTAINYYPELRDANVRFVYKNIKTTLAARPSLLNIFKKRENRIYTIYIDNKVKDGEGVLLENFPFNAQVGGLGHEYAHIIDYGERSKLNLLWLGIKYFFSAKARAKLEHKVDKITIERGLGWQTLAWERHIFEHSKASKKYKSFKEGLYLSSEDIMEHMRQCPLYDLID